MDVATEAVVGRLGFTPPGDVVDDHERPGLLRASTRKNGANPDNVLDYHLCPVTDCLQVDGFTPDLMQQGFDVADLSPLTELQELLSAIRLAEHITDEQAEAIQAAVNGADLTLESGKTVSVQFVSTDGLVMRIGGPNGLKVHDRPMTTRNDHGTALSIHIDQDVLGTPMKQLMDGRAPELFRHSAPDSQNDDGQMMLLNVWVPLDQVTRPLVLGDGTSIDRQKHQLRYGLLVEGFLERDEDQKINDIWTMLPDDDQRWYFHSELAQNNAYIFDTLSTPHGSFIVPGEEIAEQAYHVLQAAEDAVRGGDVDALVAAVDIEPFDVSAAGTPALGAAIAEMGRVVDQARADAEHTCTGGAEQWLAESAEACRRVVRKSIEMRIVATVAD